MATTLGSIQNGMDVYDSTGDKIGSVSDVLTLAAYSQKVQNDPYAAGAADTSELGSGVADQQGVLKVAAGGVLGIGAKDLYVPFDAVQTITPGDSIALNCTRAQCENAYSDKPSFLENV